MGKLFEELKTMKEAYDRKLQHEGEAAVKDAFKDVFDKFPEISSIVWAQYTAYFNDGDPCYFSVHDFDVNLGSNESIVTEITEKKRLTVEAANAGDYKKAQSLKEEVEELEGELEDENNNSYDYGNTWGMTTSSDPREVEIANAIRELANELPDDVLESVFGDHVKIVATRKGFEVTEFEHD